MLAIIYQLCYLIVHIIDKFYNFLQNIIRYRIMVLMFSFTFGTATGYRVLRLIIDIYDINGEKRILKIHMRNLQHSDNSAELKLISKCIYFSKIEKHLNTFSLK